MLLTIRCPGSWAGQGRTNLYQFAACTHTCHWTGGAPRQRLLKESCRFRGVLRNWDVTGLTWDPSLLSCPVCSVMCKLLPVILCQSVWVEG